MPSVCVPFLPCSACIVASYPGLKGFSSDPPAEMSVSELPTPYLVE